MLYKLMHVLAALDKYKPKVCVCYCSVTFQGKAFIECKCCLLQITSQERVLWECYM